MNFSVFIFVFALLSFAFADEECPEGQVYMFMKSSSGVNGSYRILSSEGVVQVHENITKSYKKKLCLPPEEYVIELYSEEGTVWDDYLLAYENAKDLVEEFKKDSTAKVQTERFPVQNTIPYGSVFKYITTTTMVSDWMKPTFMESDWKEGKAGEWGLEVENANTYFRKSFAIPHPSKYSTAVMEISLFSSHARVYLNGEDLRRFTLPDLKTPAITSLFMPASLFTPGENTLAVMIACRNSSSPVVFDLKLHLSTTRCRYPEYSGKARDDQPNPDPMFPPAGAFSSMGWIANTLPVNLFYDFGHEKYAFPTYLSMEWDKSNEFSATELRVYGRVLDYGTNETLVEEEIGAVNSELFFKKVRRETIPLASKRPYNAIRIHFLKGRSDKLRIQNIELPVCQQGKCAATRKLKETLLGDRIWTRCPLGYIGHNQQRCERNDVQPTWREDRSMCLRRIPHRYQSYVDLEMKVTDLRVDEIDERLVSPAKQLIEMHLPVWDQQITFPIHFQTIEDSSYKVDSVMRLVVEAEAGKYVYKKLVEYLPQFREELANALEGYTIEIASLPTLRRLPDATSVLIYCISICIAFVAGMGVTLCFVRSRKTLLMTPKKLKKGREMTLLENTDV